MEELQAAKGIRTSLAAESQACATAIDELSIVKLIFGLLRDPNLTSRTMMQREE